ncbi:hypothetical protein CsSME_00001444 [Camellia sinensis var. sinensis]
MEDSSLPPNLSLLISNFNSLIIVKLESNNFLIWKSQMTNVLLASGFLDHVNGSNPCPSPEFIDASGKTIPNPSYAKWQLIDAHLHTCRTATLSSSIYSSVIHLTHSDQVWQFLKK